jgi:steroid 5-alpha reductase family enzyme
MLIKLIIVALAVILTGVVSYFIAKRNGRNSMVWFLAGVIFNFLTIGLLLFLKNLKFRKFKQVTL